MPRWIVWIRWVLLSSIGAAIGVPVGYTVAWGVAEAVSLVLTFLWIIGAFIGILIGGAVGGQATVVVGGPTLVAGSDYVLCLKRGELPGTGEVLTMPDHIQGVFDVVESKDGGGRRAISQGIEHGLLPDEAGATEVPGGKEGLPLEELRRRIRQFDHASQ